MGKIKVDRNIILYIGFIVFSILFEVVSFSVLDLGFLPKYFLFDFGFLLIVCGLINLIPSFIFRSIFCAITLLFQIVIAIVNVILYQSSNELFSFKMISVAGEGISVFDISFLNFAKLIVIGIALIIFITLLVLNFKKNIKNKVTRNYMQVIALSLAILLVGYSSYSIQREMLYSSADSSEYFMFKSENYLYTTLTSKTDAYSHYGTFGFYFKDITNLIKKDKPTNDELSDAVDYFISGVGQQNNSEYYGISKDNNVITMLLESVEYYAVDPIFTPNLYNLFYKDGILLSNFYANNKTNMSEGLTLFGSYSADTPISKASDNVIDIIGNKYYDNSIAQKLNAEGYETSYFHANTENFYSRLDTFSSSTNNFSNLYFYEDMDKLSTYNGSDFAFWSNMASDNDVIDQYFDLMCPSDKKFYTHYTSITTHGAYTEKDKQIAKANYDTLLDPKNSDNYDAMWEYLTDTLGYTKPNTATMLTHFNWYKATAMELDQAIGTLFTKLSENNLLENTTILFFADHNAYYHDLYKYMKKDMTNGNTYDTENYHIPAVIYDQKLSAKLNNVEHYGDTIEENGNEVTITGYNHTEFCSTFNLCTTMLDILGETYNPNFYMGDSVFLSDSTSSVFQPNIGDRPYFNDQYSIIYNSIKWCKDYDDETLQNFKSVVAKLYLKVEYIDMLYTYPSVIKGYGKALSKL